MGVFHPKIPNLRGLEPNDPKSGLGSSDFWVEMPQFWVKAAIWSPTPGWEPKVWDKTPQIWGKIFKFWAKPLDLVPSCPDLGPNAAILGSKIPFSYPQTPNLRRSDPKPGLEPPDFG